MSYQVVIHREAAASIADAYNWISERSEAGAQRWLDGMESAIQSLSELPYRCGLAAESDLLGFELRQKLYGRRSGRYRILFVIRSQQVHVMEVRHAARRTLTPEDFDSSSWDF